METQQAVTRSGGDAPDQPAGAGTVAADLERYRVALTGYCYRMLGSPSEAEDATQETLVRAWRSADRFDPARASPRTWLFTIATRVCLDMLRSAQRRVRAMDLGPATPLGGSLGAPLPDATWVWPVPDHRVLPGLSGEGTADPADVVAGRDTVRLAFVAALQHLPPRQRAVLILRDVLCWRADEVATLLDTTVASVTSALQRARATLAARDPEPTDPFDPLDDTQRDLLSRYVDAFTRHDVEALVSLLHEDAVSSMPPFHWWLRGRARINTLLRSSDACRGDILLPTVANGSPAFGQYRAGPDGVPEAFGFQVVEVSGGLITGMTTYLGAVRLFPLFDLPTRLPPGPLPGPSDV